MLTAIFAVLCIRINTERHNCLLLSNTHMFGFVQTVFILILQVFILILLLPFQWKHLVILTYKLAIKFLNYYYCPVSLGLFILCKVVLVLACGCSLAKWSSLNDWNVSVIHFSEQLSIDYLPSCNRSDGGTCHLFATSCSPTADP